MSRLTPANLSVALTALGVDESAANERGWLTTTCPACGDDVGKSFRVNVHSGEYKCFRCMATSGDNGPGLHDFLGSPTKPGLTTMAVTRSASDMPEMSDELVARYHRFLLQSPSVLSDLERKRGWTEETTKRLMVGWDGAHLWIPIRDDSSVLVNARMYDPFGRARNKSKHYANAAGMKRTACWVPFGVESLKGEDTLWMFEGEPDGILAAQLGFPAIVITGGSGAWSSDVLRYIGKRKVVLCYDFDAAGERGAKSIMARLRGGGVQEVIIFKGKREDAGKDFSNLVLKDKRNVGWFNHRAKAQWDGKVVAAIEEDEEELERPPIPVKLDTGIPGERVTLKAHVLGSHTVPILVPESCEVRCNMDWQERACRGCPVGVAEGKLRINIEPESQELAVMCVTKATMHENELKRMANIPMRCPRATFEPMGTWQVQYVKLIPPMSDRQGGDSTIRSAMCVTQADGRPMPVRANQLYEFNGKVIPDVLTNEWTLMSSESRPAEDDVDSFQLNSDLLKRFKASFQPDEWTPESIEEKMLQEERRMARHVTKVYGRELLLRFVDLCYHSVLRFSFKDGNQKRGWMSLLIFGDARTGKSETMSCFSNYIGLGKFVMDPANTTYAGLVGGLQQVGRGDKSWTITWGLIPTNDRGLVVVDELSSLSVDDIGKMSGMRSSGIAEITKIRSASTPARTRLIMSGNPRGQGRTLSSFGTPVEGLMDLIGAPEDVARFDCALGVKQGLDKDEANRRLGSQDQPVDVGLRRKLVMYAWSRQADQVKWEDGAEVMAGNLAHDMANRYHYGIPLVEPSEQDLRVARVAVASAVRTFSHTETDPNVVLVRKAHVRFAVNIIDQAFGGDIGYTDYSDFLKRQELKVKPVTKSLLGIQRDVGSTCRALLSIKRVTPNSIGMATALDGNEARHFISIMAQNGAARFAWEDNRNTAMSWTASFITLLRKYENDPPKVEEEEMF